jgi:hypothetical protein
MADDCSLVNVCNATMDPRKNATLALPDRIRSDNVCTELVSNKIDVASLGSGMTISGEYVSFPESDDNAAFNRWNFNCKSLLLLLLLRAEFVVDDDDDDESALVMESDASADSNCHRNTSLFLIDRLCSISLHFDERDVVTIIITGNRVAP